MVFCILEFCLAVVLVIRNRVMAAILLRLQKLFCVRGIFAFFAEIGVHQLAVHVVRAGCSRQNAHWVPSRPLRWAHRLISRCSASLEVPQKVYRLRESSHQSSFTSYFFEILIHHAFCMTCPCHRSEWYANTTYLVNSGIWRYSSFPIVLFLQLINAVFFRLSLLY